MRLAQALNRRKRLYQQLKDLQARIAQNALAPEDGKPAEDPAELRHTAESLLRDYRTLVYAINVTNSQSHLSTWPTTITLTAAMAQRDALDEERALVKAAIDAAEAGGTRLRYTRTEIKHTPTFDVTTWRKRLDELSERRSVLDTAIQETNWAVDLATVNAEVFDDNVTATPPTAAGSQLVDTPQEH